MTITYRKHNEQARALSAVELAHRQTLLAIHLTVAGFGDDSEFSILLARLQDIGVDLETIKNQMIRIKTRLDAEALGYA